MVAHHLFGEGLAGHDEAAVVEAAGRRLRWSGLRAAELVVAVEARLESGCSGSVATFTCTPSCQGAADGPTAGLDEGSGANSEGSRSSRTSYSTRPVS